MQHSLESPIPSWGELESSASHAVQQLNALELSFSNEQPPPDLFEHLIPAYEICDAIHSSLITDGDLVSKAPLLHLLQSHPLVLNVYNSSIVARLMREGAGSACDLLQPHLHSMQQIPRWTALRAAQNEAWCGALLIDGDKFASDKNFEHAHRCYDQALQMNSESIAAWLCKARALLAVSTFDDALQCIGRAQQIDSSNAEAEKLMQQVKTRVQELTGARPSSSSKLYQGADNAVDKARAKLGIHNKSAEQDLAAFDAELLVLEDAGRHSSGSSRHKDRQKDGYDGRGEHHHRRKEQDRDGERHKDRGRGRDGERDRDRRDRDRDKDHKDYKDHKDHKDRDRDRDRTRDRERDRDKDVDREQHKKRRHRHRHRSPSSASSGSSSSGSK